MKYEEYQVWYHTYNIAIPALLQSRNRSDTMTEVVNAADFIATFAANKFSTVEDTKPKLNEIIDSDLFKKVISDTLKDTKKK